MTASSSGITFSVPYDIAVARPLRQTTLKEREEVLKAASYNTERLPQELIYIDLKTDGGASSLSTNQLAKLVGDVALESQLGMAAEGSEAFGALSERFRNIFGFSYMVACNNGRAAERIWIKAHVKEGSIVAGNMLSASTRFHIQSNGGKVGDVISDGAHNFHSAELFKGNVDLNKLQSLFDEHRAENVACIYVELCVNSCGGHPVSLGNLKDVKAVARANRVPLFVDGSRILENSYLIKQRERGYQSRSIEEIVRETCSLADGVTMSGSRDFLVPDCGFIGMRELATYRRLYLESYLDGSQPKSTSMEIAETALKEIFGSEAHVASRVDQIHYLWRRLHGGIPILVPAGGHGVFIDVKKFLPHVSAEGHPAEALAAFIYHVSGIRLTKGPPLAPSQVARGIEVLRLAVPARRYVQGHMDDVTEAVLYAYARRNEIKGLKQIEKRGNSKYDPPVFAPL